MSAHPASRRLHDDDILYRKVDPGRWDDEGPTPGALDDRYDAQSFCVASRKSPKAVLEKFAAMPAVRKALNDPEPDAAALYDAGGYRVLAIPYRVVRRYCQVKPTKDGADYAEDGHVNVIHAKAFREELATDPETRLLDRAETLR